MRYIILLLLTVIIIPLRSELSDIRISFSSGIAEYSMESIKRYVNEYENKFYLANDIKLKKSDNFPPYFYFTGEIKGNIIDNHYYGLHYTYYSTGRRLSIGNDQVSWYTDFIATANIIGVIYQTDFEILKQWHLKPFSSFDFIFSDLDVIEKLSGFREPTEVVNNYKASSNGVSIGVDFVYEISNFSIGLRLYYYFEHSVFFSAEFETEESSIYQTDLIIESDWRGFRSGLILDYNFDF